jgi:serine/threonine protein kinase
MCRQVETMKKLRDHPNVLTLRAVAYAGPKGAEQEAFLLLDLCRESLVDHMRGQEGPLSDADVLTVFHSVCRAVALMHHQNPPLSHRRARLFLPSASLSCINHN